MFLCRPTLFLCFTKVFFSLFVSVAALQMRIKITNMLRCSLYLHKPVGLVVRVDGCHNHVS